MGVTDYVVDDWAPEEQTWFDPGSVAERFVAFGPTRRRPLSGEAFRDEEESHLLFLDRRFAEEHPGCEEHLIDAGLHLDATPGLLVDAAAPRVAPLPDELFMREFMAVDPANDGEILAFILEWGLLAETGVVESAWQLVPTVWAEWAADSTELPEPDPELRRLYEHHSFQEIAEYQRRKKDEALDEAAALAARYPLQATLDEHGRITTGLRQRLWDAISNLATSEEGDERVYGRGTDSAVGLRLHQLDMQRGLVVIYQAVFESWMLLDPASDLALNTLAEPPRDEVLAAWDSRGLPTPRTKFELISTLQEFINDATRYNGPRVELTHPVFDRTGIAYGRPVPSILNAMCLQLLAWLSEGIPARRCANANCNRWFSRQRGRARHGQYRASGVLYCSSSCAKAAAQREYRRRKRGTA